VTFGGVSNTGDYTVVYKAGNSATVANTTFLSFFLKLVIGTGSSSASSITPSFLLAISFVFVL
jgi:hypothetical protein